MKTDMVYPTFFRSAAVMAILLSVPGWGQAQGSDGPGRTRYAEPKFRMGLHLLPSVAWLDARDLHTRSDGSIMRFGFGFTADVMFADNYAVGTGINVFRNGGKLTYYDRVTGDPFMAADDSTSFLVRRDRKLTQHWVELPLSFKFRTREIGHITYWGQFGLGLGLNLRSTADDAVDYLYRGVPDGAGGVIWQEETTIAAADDGIVRTDDIPVEDEVALLRAAMIVGLGIEYNLSGKTALLVGATFNNGLANVANNRNFGAARDTEHIMSAPDGSLDPSGLEGYKIKMVDNAILFSLGLLF